MITVWQRNVNAIGMITRKNLGLGFLIPNTIVSKNPGCKILVSVSKNFYGPLNSWIFKEGTAMEIFLVVKLKID
jgi:hypothetical protein